MDFKTLKTPEIIKAVMAGDSVPDAMKSLIDRKEREFVCYKADLKMEAEGVKLLVEALALPDGTAGHDVAVAIITELRERYPSVAEEADERIAAKKKAKEREIESICAR